MSDTEFPRPRRPDVFETVFQVALLSFRRSLRGVRMLAALAVVLLPAALSLLMRRTGRPEQHEGFFYGSLSFYHFGIAVPVVALTFATQFPWPEAEEGTLTYWFTSPVRRSAVHFGRWCAGLALGWILLPLSVLAIWLPLDAPESAGLPVMVRAAITATFLAYPAYLALFWLIATVFRRGLAGGIVFVAVEFLLSIVPSNISKLTLVHYVRSQLDPAIPTASRALARTALQINESETVSMLTSASLFVTVTVLALGLSLLTVEAIEYRGKTSQPG